MKSTKNYLSCALLRLSVLACLLVGWFGDAKACKLEDTYRYTVVLEGSDKVRIKMPLYDKEDNDCWVQYGYLTIQIEESQQRKLLSLIGRRKTSPVVTISPNALSRRVLTEK